MEIFSKEQFQEIYSKIKLFVNFDYDKLLDSEKEEFTKSMLDIADEIEYFSTIEPYPDYKPYREIRKDFHGEVAMMKHWNKLMNTLPSYYDRMINFILCDEDISIRDARICSSIILWLGTNVGGAMLHEGNRIKERVSHPYSVAFHLDSMQYPFFDPLDYLRRIVTFDDKNFEVTVDDLVTVHKLMIWLGKKDGQEFLSDVDEEIKIRVEVERNVYKKLRNIK